MARRLVLYSAGFNHDETTHFIFTRKANYLNALEAHFLFSLPFNTWRINNGRVLVSRASFDLGQIDFKKVVYIADVDDEKKEEATFYHVQRAYDQSEYIVFEISLDNWATFLPNATISQLHVTRCNRAIGEGIYDEVKNTSGVPFNYWYNGALNRPIDEYCVVFLVSVVLATSWFGSDPLTQSVMFYLPLEDVGGKAVSEWAEMDILDKVRFLIGGLKETTANIGTTKLQVLRCWILPKTLARAGAYGLNNLKGNSFVAGGDYSFSNVYVAQCGTFVEQYAFTDFLGVQQGRYPAESVQFGVRGHTMPLTRFTNDRVVNARVMVEASDVRVQVEQGFNILDISAGFELDININNQVGTFTQQLAKNAGKILGLVGATAKAYAKGGKVAAGFTAAAGLLGMQEGGGASSPASNNGDAYTTYSLNDADYVTFPFVLCATPSIQDEDANAYFGGAMFDEYNSDFSAMQQSAHLGKVTASEERNDTFIVADAMNVSGLNAEAEEFIRSEFKRGIWFEVI